MGTRTLARDATWSLVSHVLNRGTMMLAAIVLARTLDPADFAAYSYFQLTVTMLGIYAALGLGVTAARFFADVGHERKGVSPPPLGALTALSVLLSLAGTLIVFAIPSEWLSAGLEIPRWLLAVGVGSVALGIVPAGAINGLERYRADAYISGVSGIIMLLGAWIAAANQAPEQGMKALVIALLFQATGQYYLVAQIVGFRRLFHGFRLNKAEVRRVYGFAGPMMIVSLLATSGAWVVGRIILAGPGAEHAFALYSIGLQWFALTLLLPGMLSRVILPRLVRLAANDAGSRSLVRRGALASGATAVLMVAFASPFSPWIAKAYGGWFDAGAWFIVANMASAIISAPVASLSNFILARDGQWTWMRITFVAISSMILAAILGVNAGYGAWAGALANSVNGLVLCLLAYLAYRRLHQW